MEITCELENMTAIGFTGSLHKLKLAFEVADAYANVSSPVKQTLQK